MIGDGRFMRASRLVSILMLLQTRGRVSARMLAEHLEVSTRTVYRDIDELSASGVPVVVERGSAGGFELLEGWRTTLTGLTPHESQTLFLSGLPGPVAELGLRDTMASAHLKLLAALPRAWQLEAQRVSSRFHVDLAGWYRRVKPVEHLRALADAVWADRWVAVRYESWEGIVERELEPLGLIIKAGEWYLAALPRNPRGERGGRGRGPTPRTYRVSNIRELTVHGEFVRASGFDLGAYWSESTRRFERDIYRITADVRLSPRGRKLLRNENAAVEDAIDQAAASVDDHGWLRVTIPIESIGHAAGQLLSLGSDVEVLGPPELRDRVRDTARAVADAYAPVSRAGPPRRARAPRSPRRSS
jgi:predicted DNA-binding transcriptional regulator YafY